MRVRLLIQLVVLGGGLLAGWKGRAEPIYPLLTLPEAARLRARLSYAPPGPARLHLLLALSDELLARHDELGTPLGSAAAYGRQAQALSAQLADTAGNIRSLYVLGRLPGPAGAVDTSGRVLLRRGLRLSQTLGSQQLTALGWLWLADSYPRTTLGLPRKLAGYAHAAALFKRAGRPVEYAYLLKTIADMHLLQGHSAQAEQELLRVLSLYQAAGYHHLHYTYDLLRGATRQAGNYQDALRYGLAAIECAQATRDTTALANFYTSVAIIYVELKQPARAMAYYRRTLRYEQQTQDSFGAVATCAMISRLLLLQHQPRRAIHFLQATAGPIQAAHPRMYARSLVDCYVALGQFKSAESVLRPLLALAHQEPLGDMEQLEICRTVGRFYLAAGRYAEALPQLQRALALSRSAGFLLQTAALHQQLFQADSALGRFPAAIRHYQQYKQLTDSVFNVARQQQLTSLQLHYDNRQQQQRIALLTKQNLLQQAHLRQREQQRNGGLAVAALLLLVLALGYNRYRLKQRSNRLLQAQQAEIELRSQRLTLLLTEKEWMLREIHHRVKNNLQIIGSLLHTQADYTPDPAAFDALLESQHRVQALALVHQHLYQADRVGWVPLPAYAQELAAHLLEAFDATDRIQLHLDLAPLSLPVAVATPLGLAINELLINALIHGFSSGLSGQLSLHGRFLTSTTYQFNVADDGQGLPPGFDPAQHTSLGLVLVTGLSRQLDGEFALVPNPTGRGVEARLCFAVAGAAEPPLTWR